jgi:hypothetical protein
MLDGPDRCRVHAGRRRDRARGARGHAVDEHGFVKLAHELEPPLRERDRDPDDDPEPEPDEDREDRDRDAEELAVTP